MRFTVEGLISPATVAESIFIYATGIPNTSTVTFCIDGHRLSVERQPPFWLGGQREGTPVGYSLRTLEKGSHHLYAVARAANGEQYTSDEIELHLIASINGQLSDDLAPYANQIGTRTGTLSDVLQSLSTRGANLSPLDVQTRRDVLSMYLNWGIDPSIDIAHDSSEIMRALAPKRWSSQSAGNSDSALSMRFSRDAPFYQAIPSEWPRVALPPGTIRHVQLSTATGGDGLGYGEVVAQSSDVPGLVSSQWYANERTHKVFSFRMPARWYTSLPSQPAGDSHMIFIDPRAATFVSTYKTTANLQTRGPQALYASSPTPLLSMGDKGGSNAANIAELPLLVQPGEATDRNKPIRHAIGGALGRVWAARVYPASARDANVLNGENTCTHRGFVNTGLVPYGGVLQLDPSLDLTSLDLSLPARRILRAMQQYGYYVLDFGCADLDIYTATSEAEFEPFGGLWGFNHKGRGVQIEIEEVIAKHLLYIVPPLTKKQ